MTLNGHYRISSDNPLKGQGQRPETPEQTSAGKVRQLSVRKNPESIKYVSISLSKYSYKYQGLDIYLSQE
jgi:hypothetical protein